ncbi:hypothetical protein TNCV_3206471 [Trichonephila clavipes]|nr:hypothetical protein TNCV_3206471 [Trichonephila clavipes]
MVHARFFAESQKLLERAPSSYDAGLTPLAARVCRTLENTPDVSLDIARYVGPGQLNFSSLLQWVDKSVPKKKLASGLKHCFGVSLLNDHLIGTSAHAPKCPMIKYTGMGAVGPGPHGLLRH